MENSGEIETRHLQPAFSPKAFITMLEKILKTDGVILDQDELSKAKDLDKR